MTISDMDFFHQATLKVCSSLDIEKVILECYQYLKNFIPLDVALLNSAGLDRKTIQNLTMASAKGTNKLSAPIYVPENFDWMMTNTTESIVIEKTADKHPIGRAFKAYIPSETYSAMILRLVIDGELLGALSLFAGGNDRYTKEHARLASMLNDPLSLALSNAIKHQEILRLKEMLADDNLFLKKEISQMQTEEIIGADFGLRDIMEMVKQVAPLSSQVLILGETGVGKEVIANAIHKFSPRRDYPLIKVNCGAIPENLIDSELFGHEKGAFTGAISQKKGRFERAHKGTIFLDEIGELPLAAQIRLLRVIQTREIERVGGERPIPVDIRIIAATHRNLEQMVREGKFREDLWFRLNVFPITVPPLRHRKSDIPALVEYFCEKKSQELNIDHDPAKVLEAIKQLHNYNWPGNVRELGNLVERALIRSRAAPPGTPLSLDGFLFDSDMNKRQTELRQSPIDGNTVTFPLNLDEANRRFIQTALKSTNGRIQGEKGAAKLLGIHPNTLRNRMKKLGVQFRREKTDA